MKIPTWAKWVFGLAAVGGAAYVGSRVIQEAEAATDWELQFEKPKIKHITWSAIDMDLIYRIINRASAHLTLDRIYLEVFRKGKQLGVVDRKTSVTVRANGSDEFTVPLLLNNKAASSVLAEELKAIAKGEQLKELEIELIGFAIYRSGLFNVTARYPIDYKIDLKEFLPASSSLKLV